MLLSLTSSTKPHVVQKTPPQTPSQPSGKIPGILKDSIKLSSPQFGSRLVQNHGVKFPLDVKLDFEQSGQAQHALLLKCLELAAKGDKSHLLFSMDMWSKVDQIPERIGALADTLTMSARKVDTLVEGYTNITGLRVLQTASGKRYMNQYSSLMLGQPEANVFGHVKDARARLRRFNESQRELEWLVMNRSGKTSLKKVYKDLHSGENINALSSLAYGKKGLIDAVIVGEDQLLTRPVLEKFYQSHGLSGKEKKQEREQFNKDYKSMDDIILWAKKEKLLETFNHFAPESISETSSSLQKSILDKDAIDLKKPITETSSIKIEPKEQQQKMTDLIQQLSALVGNTVNKTDKKADVKTRFHFHNEKFDKTGEVDLPRSFSLTETKEGKSVVTEIQHIPAAFKENTFARDSIIFPTGFSIDTGSKLESAMNKIYEKKGKLLKARKPVSNALIIENSPGGYSVVTEQIKSNIESAPIPTDVIIQGWGASGGSKLVSMATGNRFATPGSGILLHETRSAGDGSLNQVNQDFKYTEYLSNGYQHTISKRTGRPYNEVSKDFKLDFAVNAVESILYGPKGLIDAILVGPDKILTRDAVMDFVTEKKGSPEAAQRYIDEKFIQRREGNYTASFDEHKSIKDDPLANPLQVIHELVQQGKAVPLGSIERFKASASDVAGQADRTMHLYKIAAKPPTPAAAKK
jgi:ATP-dependent protease ClpP protease subunit